MSRGLTNLRQIVDYINIYQVSEYKTTLATLVQIV